MNIENRKQFATILLAVGLGLIAAFLTSQYIKTSIESQTKALAEKYKKDNAEIRAAFVKEIELRDREFNKKLQQLAQQQQAQIQQAVASRPQAAPGKPAQIVDSTVFSTLTPAGKRAVTVLIDSLSAVGGLVNPGDYIDILAQLEIPKTPDSKDKNKVTSVLFQNIQVLAVDSNFKPIGNALVYQQQQKSRQLNVTLAVDPEEVGLLTFAQTNGQLKLALRSPTERDTKVLEVAAWETLSDYVLDRQGTELEIPQIKATIKSDEGEEIETEVKPFIEIFRGGREL